MKSRPEILSTQTLAKTRLFHIEQVDLRFANGTEVQFERMCGSPQGAVLIVPMLDEETVILVREYAAGTGRYELALPKGRIGKDEPVIEAANREMMEEIGYAARSLEHLASMTLAPGYSSHMTHIVLAQDLYPCKAEGDEPEPVEPVNWSIRDMPGLLAQPELTEARTIAALYMVRDRLLA